MLKYDPEKDDQIAVHGKELFAKAAFGEDATEIGGFAKSQVRIDENDEELSGKLLVLKQLLKVWKLQPRSRVLIFSHYGRILDIIERMMQRNGMRNLRLDGQTSSEHRNELVESFNNPMNNDNFVFLISTKAGGTGLNLTAANIVVLFDSNWNPSYDAQAQDRAYRLGQLRNVDIYRLISTGTIEDKTYCRQLYKMQLNSEALEGNKEERYFEGVQGDAKQPGELFGLKNLIAYNSRGYMSELKEQYSWKSPVVEDKLSAATKAAARLGTTSGHFTVETVRKEILPDDEPNEEAGDMFAGSEGHDGGAVLEANEDTNELDIARNILEDLGIPVDDPSKPLPKKRKKKKFHTLLESLDQIIESGNQVSGDDETATDLEEFQPTDIGEESSDEEEEEKQAASGEDAIDVNHAVGSIINEHSHMTLKSTDILNTSRGTT